MEMWWRENPSIPRRVADLVARAMPHPWSQAQLDSALASENACLEVAAEVGSERLVGLVLGRTLGADLVEIDLVAVASESRRRGRGRALLEEFIALRQARGIREFRLELAASNVAAMGLYSAVGFVVVGRRARYYPDGDDALLLTRAPTARTTEGEQEV